MCAPTAWSCAIRLCTNGKTVSMTRASTANSGAARHRLRGLGVLLPMAVLGTACPELFVWSGILNA